MYYSGYYLLKDLFCDGTTRFPNIEEEQTYFSKSMMMCRTRCRVIGGFIPSILLLAIIVGGDVFHYVNALGMISTSRFIMKAPKERQSNKPHLVLISGSPGTGKSTFAMSVALDQGILKCISTDTIRATMRSFVAPDISPALHRSSFAQAFEGDDPVRSWRETCSVLSHSVEGLIDDAMKRGTSIVVEGVHVVPHNELIKKWEQEGGVAVGVLLQIRNEEKHKRQLLKRGVMTGVIEAEEEKIASFDRIRAIQDEMMRLAKENNWIQIEQRIAPDPLDLVNSALNGDSCSTLTEIMYLNEEKHEKKHRKVKREPDDPSKANGDEVNGVDDLTIEATSSTSDSLSTGIS
jgi:predicted kinase